MEFWGAFVDVCAFCGVSVGVEDDSEAEAGVCEDSGCLSAGGRFGSTARMDLCRDLRRISGVGLAFWSDFVLFHQEVLI